jgi:hypothetical protein
MRQQTTKSCGTAQQRDPNAESTHQPQFCRCGCAPCEDVCCKPECVARPRFYCGQLLGEDDLTTLVAWSQAHLQRARYRDGWGIVCGLHVRCNPDKPMSLILGEGYAMDCCGRDIVVCQESWLDLSDACANEWCVDPGNLHPSRSANSASGGNQKAQDDEDRASSSPFADAIVVDLYLHYCEEDSHPEPTLDGCGCGQGTKCEPSRTQETYRVDWVIASTEPGHPRDQAYEVWLASYKDGMRTLLKLLDEAKEAYNDPKELRRRLRRWVKQHPLHHFCFVDAWLTSCTDNDRQDPTYLVQILFWLAMEYRLSRLTCECPRCDPQQGIRLARVWLQNPQSRNNTKCRILMIHDAPPYRRPMQPDPCLPTRTGCTNLLQLLWQRPADIERQYDIDFEVVDMPEDVNTLIRWFRFEMDEGFDFCDKRAGAEPKLLVMDAIPGIPEPRVVGFAGQSREHQLS